MPLLALSYCHSSRLDRHLSSHSRWEPLAAPGPRAASGQNKTPPPGTAYRPGAGADDPTMRACRS